jgi:hypothetical protein
MKFVDANPTARVIGTGELTGRVNYLVGKDPTKWHANIPTYANVTYRNVYPGIDAAYHDKSGQLENDLIVSPGANPTRILLRFEGADRLTLRPSGDLLVVTRSGGLCLHRPVAYQGEKGDKKTVLVSYVLRGDGEIAFQFGQFDKGQPLVIDPEITFLADREEPQDVMTAPDVDTTEDTATAGPQYVDSSGNVYVSGYVNEANFPTTAGAYQPTYPTCYQEGFITKLNSTLSAVVYSTFLGGSQGYTMVGGITVDSSGNVHVGGTTTETNFPTTAGAYLTTFPLSNQVGFIAELNPSLSALMYSTFLGAVFGQGTVTIGGPFVDSSGNIYVGGTTNETNFPTTAGAYLTTYPGGNTQTGYIAKLNPTLSTLTYSTFLGGTDASGTVTVGGPFVDSSGNVYVGGATNEPTFPTTVGAYLTTYPGGNTQTGYIARLNPTLSTLTYSTFLGGTDAGGTVTIGGFKVDSTGNVYVVGATNEPTFPTKAGAYLTTYPGGNTQAGFIAKLNSALSTLIYSTFLGGTVGGGTVTVGGPFVDSSGNVYVSGATNEVTFPTTAGAYLTTYPAGNNQVGYITKLNPTLSTLSFSTFLGAVDVSGGGSVTVGGPSVDSNGYVYVVGATNESTFPTTVGAYQTIFPTSYQAGFITRLNPSLSALSYSTFIGGTMGTVTIH